MIAYLSPRCGVCGNALVRISDDWPPTAIACLNKPCSEYKKPYAMPKVELKPARI
ncbi:MAG: hypothetical protein ACRENK_15720 [Gemmatimonadaceae bacterium]